MRWERLFDDLEAQWHGEALRERQQATADRTRRERALLGLHDRIVAHRGVRLDLTLRGGHGTDGEVVDVGAGWVLLREGPGMAALVPLAAVVQLRGLSGQAATGQAVERAKRFDIGFALRALSRDRVGVSIGDVTGAAVTGTIDGVGTDAIDVSEHPLDLPRRPENLVGRVVVAVSAIAVVRGR